MKYTRYHLSRIFFHLNHLGWVEMTLWSFHDLQKKKKKKFYVHYWTLLVEKLNKLVSVKSVFKRVCAHGWRNTQLPWYIFVMGEGGWGKGGRKGWRFKGEQREGLSTYTTQFNGLWNSGEWEVKEASECATRLDWGDWRARYGGKNNKQLR